MRRDLAHEAVHLFFDERMGLPAVIEIEDHFGNAGRLDRSMELDTKDWLAVAQPRIAKIAADA